MISFLYTYMCISKLFIYINTLPEPNWLKVNTRQDHYHKSDIPMLISTLMTTTDVLLRHREPISQRVWAQNANLVEIVLLLLGK